MEPGAIGGRIRHGLRRYIVIVTYLYVCFGTLLLYKAAVLRGAGFPYAPYGFAIVKALIVAKFLLIGEELRVGERLTRATMATAILWRSATLLLLLAVLSAIEKLLDGFVHHRSLARAIADFGGGVVAEVLATAFLVYLVLLPYVAYRALDKALGHGTLRQLMRTRLGREG